MTIDRTYPIFTVRWLAVHGLATLPYQQIPERRGRAIHSFEVPQ
jgi:hypothetical protein